MLEVVLFLSAVLFCLDYEDCQRITGYRTVRMTDGVMRNNCKSFSEFMPSSMAWKFGGSEAIELANFV